MSAAESGESPDLALSARRPYVMTAAFERQRAAILVDWVQQCAMTPPMVCVAVRKGRPIEPIIRDSHAFALCEIHESDPTLERLLRKACEHDDDVLESLAYETLATGSPCITRSGRVLDCEVMRHIDFEADYELYIAQVMRVKAYPAERRTRSARRRVTLDAATGVATP